MQYTGNSLSCLCLYISYNTWSHAISYKTYNVCIHTTSLPHAHMVCIYMCELLNSYVCYFITLSALHYLTFLHVCMQLYIFVRRFIVKRLKEGSGSIALLII